MSFLSNGEIIAIVTLVATCPPSVALLIHVIRRTCLNTQTDQVGMYILVATPYRDFA